MGKFPPSMRTARLPATALLKNIPSVLPGQESQSEKPPLKPHHHLIPKNKLTKNKPKTLAQKNTSETPKSPFTFNSPDLSEAKSLFNSILTTHKTRLDPRLCNSLLHSFSAISTLRDSISLLRHMTKTHPSFTPNRSTYHILLAQSCKSPDPSLYEVRQALNLMVNDGCPPEAATVDVGVRSLCSAGREDLAIELVKELSVKHSKPDSHTYNFLVKCLCKNRSLTTVYNFIDEMRDSFGLKPDLVTYTILIDNVCNRKNLREATRLLGILGVDGFKPDCFVYNTVMKGYCLLDQGNGVIEVYNKMREEGVEPDQVTYNTLIFGLSKSGRVKEARKFLNVMAEKGHFPDAVTYTSLMNGMCREGNALGALALLGEMEAKGCTPNECTYNTLLHGLCKSRLLERGVELYGAIKSAVETKSLKDVAAYSTLESTLKWIKKAKEQGHTK